MGPHAAATGIKTLPPRTGGRERVSSSQSVPEIVKTVARNYRAYLTRNEYTTQRREAIITHIVRFAIEDHPEIAEHIDLFRELVSDGRGDWR